MKNWLSREIKGKEKDEEYTQTSMYDLLSLPKNDFTSNSLVSGLVNLGECTRAVLLGAE